MKNVFINNVQLPEESVPLSDYTTEQLVAYLTSNYSGDPIGVLTNIYNNGEIGSILYQKTNLILEAMGYVKK